MKHEHTPMGQDPKTETSQTRARGGYLIFWGRDCCGISGDTLVNITIMNHQSISDYVTTKSGVSGERIPGVIEKTWNLCGLCKPSPNGSCLLHGVYHMNQHLSLLNFMNSNESLLVIIFKEEFQVPDELSHLFHRFYWSSVTAPRNSCKELERYQEHLRKSPNMFSLNTTITCTSLWCPSVKGCYNL